MCERVRRQRRWILRDEPEKQPGGGIICDLHPVLCRVLGYRGVVAEDEVSLFLEPKLKNLSDPFEIPEMGLAVARIFQAIDQGEEICVYGDYDVDGITSITIMTSILRAYGGKARHFIPIRSTEGYGLSEVALERCLAEGVKPSLLIAVDCGTVSHDAIVRLNEQGIDVVVVDHHEKGPAGRPPCVALVNPKFVATPYDYLCAAGVVFKLAHAMLKTRELAEYDLKDVLDLVAVATIADIVPLVGENRLLVRHGLRKLSRTRNRGLRALMDITGLNGRTSSSDVGFRIGPRINAAGRMDRPEEALKTLLADDAGVARGLASRLDHYNRQRQKTELQILAEAEQMLAVRYDVEREPVIVLGSRDWHPGVVGIVASRLMRKYHRPVFVVAIDPEKGIGKGSGRSIEGVSLVEAINATREFLLAGGGHHMAAGISLMEDCMDRFREAFGKFVLSNATDEDLEPRLLIDGVLRLEDVGLDFLHQYERLQPFGSGNPIPIFMVREVWPVEPPQHLRNNHLKLWLRQDTAQRDAMYFGGGEYALPEPPWDVAFTVDRNNFRGKTTCQIMIREIRSAITSES